MKATSDILVQKWNELLEHPDLPKIRDRQRKVVTAQLLENQEQEMLSLSAQGYGGLLTEAPTNSSGAFPSNTNLKGYDPVLIALLRRAMPNLISFDVCGTQQLQASSGMIFFLKSTYSTQGGTEALFNEANTAFSGKGSQAGTNPMPQANSTAYKAGTAMTTTEGEALGDGLGTNFAEMAFSIGKVTVSAGTRALKSTYSLEIQQDLKATHGLDAENELANILTNELLSEINREVIRTIYNNAVVGAQDNVANAGVFDLDVDSNGRWSVEKFKGLMFQIERDANKIMTDTRRGRGNILITSADVASALSITGLLDCGSALQDNLSHDGIVGNSFVGVLNNRFKVFVDPYVPAASGYYVVGYRGASPYDAGLFFCPYIGLTMVRAVDPLSFQPAIGFKTRYGIIANPFATTAQDGALTYNTNLYYRKVEVQNLM